jgi:hypothetical protein
MQLVPQWFAGGGVALLLAAHISAWSASVPAKQRTVWERYPNETATNVITATLTPAGETPEFMAIVVQQGGVFADLDEALDDAPGAPRRPALAPRARAAGVPPAHPFVQATWVPFQTNVTIDLGPGDGERVVLISYRYKGQQDYSGYSGGGVTVRTARPSIQIVNPTNLIVSEPLILLQGASRSPLREIRFDRFNEQGERVVENAEGFPGRTYMGDPKARALENYFSCYDVVLDPGTNRFEFRFRDYVGNTGATNFVIVFSTAHDRTAPVLKPVWPQPGARLTGGRFTARGNCDEHTARLSGQIVGGGTTNSFFGSVEYNGTYWYDGLPLAVGENRLTLEARDAAGNCLRTNMVLFGSDDVVLTLDPVEPVKLLQAFTAVSGKVSPSDRDVWINGVAAKVSPDGTWRADRVPVHSPNAGGTAVFEATALPRNAAPPTSPAKDFVAAQATLGTNELVLNASSPACGEFRMHLSNTADKGFILFASTNLTKWSPILTNATPEASFDYREDVRGTPCRFFKVVPLP